MIYRRAGLLALLCLPLFTACGGKTPAAQPVAAGSVVVALGDSLTSGVGAKTGEDWPSLLAELTEWDVINGGISGNTSAQGAQRLPELLSEHAPSLVIVGLGGNDFLRRQSPDMTRQSLTQSVRNAQAAGAQVVLVAIPEPSLMAAAGAVPSDHPLYASLAKELNVPLISGLWGPILGNPDLRADTVHANAQGYAAFAQTLVQALRSAGFLQH